MSHCYFYNPSFRPSHCERNNVFWKKITCLFESFPIFKKFQLNLARHQIVILVERINNSEKERERESEKEERNAENVESWPVSQLDESNTSELQTKITFWEDLFSLTRDYK